MDKWARNFEMQWAFREAQWLTATPKSQPPWSRFTLQSETFGGTCCKTPFTRYRVIIQNAGDMCCFWSNVWLVERAGSVALPPVNVTAWDGGDQQPDWKDALSSIHDELRGGTDYPRLEGYMPVTGDACNPRVDHVQMVLLDQAITEECLNQGTEPG